MSVGAVVDAGGGGKRVGYRTPFHAKMAVTIALIKMKNPDWFEHRYLESNNDVLFYDSSRSSELRHSSRVDSQKLDAESPIIAFSRRKDRCIWIDCEALAEVSRPDTDLVYHKGRGINPAYNEYDRERDDFFPLPAEKEKELRGRWSGKKGDLITYHHEASRMVRKTFDRVVKCRKFYSGVGGELPGGWIEVTVERRKKGATDKYYISPGGHCFRSMTEVGIFLGFLSGSKGSERSAILLAEDAIKEASAKRKEAKKMGR